MRLTAEDRADAARDRVHAADPEMGRIYAEYERRTAVRRARRDRRQRDTARAVSLAVCVLGLVAMVTGQAIMECVVIEQAALVLAVLAL